MNIRHHQYINVAVVLFFILICLHSYLTKTRIIGDLALISLCVITVSLVTGIILAAYIAITHDQIFDPLSSGLDEDPDDV